MPCARRDAGQLGRIKHGLAGVLNAATSGDLLGETYEPVIGAIALLLRACAEDSSIRAGHDPDDVLLIPGLPLADRVRPRGRS